MRAGFDGPPARGLVARDFRGIKRGGVTVAKGVVGSSAMTKCAGVFLLGAVEPHAVGAAQFLPNPPVILGPDFIKIAMPITKEDGLGGAFNFGPAALVVLA